MSRRTRQGRSIQAVVAALYDSLDAPGSGFKLIDETDVVRPPRLLLLDPEHPTKVICDEVDGRWVPQLHDPWECDETDCLKLKALALVGLRPEGRNYRLGERHVPVTTVEDWLDLVVPDRDGTRS